jgi:hypothetical protein
MRVGNHGRQIVRADSENRGVSEGGQHGAPGSGSVLRLSRKVSLVDDPLAAVKRRNEAGAETGAAPKRPKLVKFVMS